MSEPTKILIVEDEAHMRCFLRTTLARNGYEPLEAADGVQAIEQATRPDVGLILLDLGLPDVDGLQVVSWVRERSSVPIIVLTARHFEFEKIETLDLGANDYVTKPFGAGELLARIRVALRQRVEPNGVASSVVVVGELRVDLDARIVEIAGKEVHLTPTEHKLLAVLARRLGRVVSHHEILREVWGAESSEQVETLRVFMRQLRYKLEPEPTQPRYLLTASGVGYRLKGEVQ
jgi:two-component system KDP operon response regulator KdpE